MGNRHKHADLIHAWAEGAEIEFKANGDNWIAMTEPNFRSHCEYRIKPVRKPDVVKYLTLVGHPMVGIRFVEGNTPGQLRCTFCGETGKLIKAEVL